MKTIKKMILSTFWILSVLPDVVLGQQSDSFIQTLKAKKTSGQKLLPTEALFLKYALSDTDWWKKYSSNWALDSSFDWARLVTQITNIEKKMESQGCVTFVHARRWEWNFFNDVWNLISAIINNQATISDKISLRQRDMQHTDTSQLYDMRTNLLLYGTCSGTGINKTGKASEVTFMNRTIFSTYSEEGDCTGHYFLSNHSCATFNQFWDKLYNLLYDHGFSAYYYDFYNLFLKHQALSQYGEILCIGVKKQHVNDLIYAAIPWAYKDISCSNVLDRVLDTEKKVKNKLSYFDDDKWNLYCFAVTDIPGEYNKKYTIKSVHLADPIKHKQYKKDLQLLFEKIKKDWL